MTQGDLFGEAGDLAPRPHRLLLASAGTGKTFQLANHFAGLLIAGAAPESILATTFTRKAAGEILDRVLGRLREGAQPGDAGAETRDFVLGAASRVAGRDVTAGPEAFRRVLAELVRAVDRFQVRTLDSFFIRLSQAFAAELDIRQDWRVTDETEERGLRAEAVARILEGLERGERLELVRGIAARAGARETASALFGAVEAGDFKSRLAVDGAWRRIEPLGRPSDVELDRAAAVIRGASAPTTKKGTPVKRWADALAAASEALTDAGESWDGATPRLKGLVGAGPWKAVMGWITEGRPPEPPTYERHPVEGELLAAFAAVVDLIIAASVDELIERNLANERLLSLYAEADAALRAELGAYRFEDFPLALLEGPVRGSRDQWRTDLAYRLDGRIDHLLLDEFQDTAPVQWQLIEPLAEEIIEDGSGGRSFFCVGDLKQSIYGWRGGEPRLLGEMGARFPERLDETTLKKSFRSASVVLDAVNVVFTGLLGSAPLARADRAPALEAARAWTAGFEPHVAARKELAGEANLWRARAARDGEARNDPSIKLAVELVRRHVEARPGASVGVLVRAKANIPQLRFLLKEAGIESSDEGGNPLTDSGPVTLVLALLQLADHPGDGVCRLQVARAGFAPPFALDREQVDTEEGRLAASRVARAVRAALLEEGYGAFCAARAAELSACSSEWDRRRLEQLVELCLQADERPPLRPVDLCTTVREARVPDPTASPVKVMTVHASKGLEFDVVVLPELFKGIDLAPSGVIAHAPDITRPAELLSVSPKKDVAALHPHLRELRSAQEQRSAVDAYSSLYVAMTRAVHALELVVPPLPKSGKVDALTYANLCVESLTAAGRGDEVGPAADPDDHGAPELDHATRLWRHADSMEDWTLPREGEDATFVEPAPALVLRPATSRAVPPARVTPSSLGAAHAGSGGRAARVGTLVHALLEGVEWLEDGLGDPEPVLRRLDASDGGNEGAEALERARRALASSAAAAAFGRPGPGARVLRERSFDVDARESEEGPLRMFGAIDRLVLDVREGAVVGAHVIDFKTDAAADTDALREAHRRQLEAYRAAAGSLLALPLDLVRASLLWIPAEGEAVLVEVE